jgi:hypothetical protein
LLLFRLTVERLRSQIKELQVGPWGKQEEGWVGQG